MATFAARPIEVVEILQPLCSRVFGSDPCLATGDACWNTDATCKYRSALDLSKSTSLRFVADNVYDWQDNNINLLAENGDFLITEGYTGGTTTPIKFVGSATAAKIGATTGDTTIALNSGLTGGLSASVSDGDLVIAVFATSSTANRTLSITDGTTAYTLISPELYANGTRDMNIRVAYKFVSGDTATTFGPTGALGDAGAMAVYVFRDVDATTPLDVTSTNVQQSGGNLISPNPPPITPVSDNTFIVALGATSEADTFTAPNLVSFVTFSSVDTRTVTFGIGHRANWPSGTFNPDGFGTAINVLGGRSWAAMTIALRPIFTPNPPDSKRFLIDLYYQPALDIPALAGYNTAPTVLNVASGSKDKSPLGYRAVCQVNIKDFPWNDIITDPYLSTRSYNPEQIGSFWTKWLARNPFHVGYTLNIYEGLIGQKLSEMTKREYVIEKIDRGKDGVSITAKDVLRKVTDTNVTAPYLSKGELSVAANNSQTNLTVAGALITEYETQGYLRINSEVISYTQVYETSGGNLYFSGLTRGVAGTTAAAHSQNDRVQRVIYYNARPFNEILYDLFVNWGGIPASYIDTAAWALEKNTYRLDYNFTAYIAEPTKIDELAGEVCLQALANVWWDERVQQIIMKAVKPEPSPYLLTDNDAIIAGSLTIKEKPEERASQSHVYYLQRTPVQSVTEKTNYTRVAVFIDVDKQIQYGGEPQIRELFCRFVPTQAIANAVAQTYLTRFSDVRREVTFDLSAKDAELIWTGSVITIRHYLDVDFTGAARDGEWLITSAEVSRNGLTYRFTAEDNEKGGVVWTWLDASGNDASGNPQPWRWLDNEGKDSLGVLQPYRWL